MPPLNSCVRENSYREHLAVEVVGHDATSRQSDLDFRKAHVVLVLAGQAGCGTGCDLDPCE